MRHMQKGMINTYAHFIVHLSVGRAALILLIIWLASFTFACAPATEEQTDYAIADIRALDTIERFEMVHGNLEYYERETLKNEIRSELLK